MDSKSINQSEIKYSHIESNDYFQRMNSAQKQ